MAELADAAGLGPVGLRLLEVRVLPPALLFESVEPEEPDVVSRRAVDREVGEDLADDRAELVPVTGEPGADDGGRALRVAADQEVLVG